MTTAPSQSDAIASLAHAVLQEVFDESDGARRAAAIARIFAADAALIDHDGARHGVVAIDQTVEQLHRRFPGFRFTHAGQPQTLAGAARLNWRFGPPSDPARITGTDAILVRDGRIDTLLVFLDPAPSA